MPCWYNIVITVLENISWTHHKKGPECLGWVCLHSVPWDQSNFPTILAAMVDIIIFPFQSKKIFFEHKRYI